MSILDDFFNLEINIGTQRKILEAIEELRNSKDETKQLTFNVYSIVISSNKKEVLVYNDIGPDDPVIEVSLDEFYKLINDHKAKNR